MKSSPIAIRCWNTRCRPASGLDTSRYKLTSRQAGSSMPRPAIAIANCSDRHNARNLCSTPQQRHERAICDRCRLESGQVSQVSQSCLRIRLSCWLPLACSSDGILHQSRAARWIAALGPIARFSPSPLAPLAPAAAIAAHSLIPSSHLSACIAVQQRALCVVERAEAKTGSSALHPTGAQQQQRKASSSAPLRLD